MSTVLRLLFFLVAGLVLAAGSVHAQVQLGFHQPKASPTKPKTQTTQTQRQDLSQGTTPVRWTQQTTESGNRKTETQVLETLGLNGRYESLVDMEQETVQVDAQTTKVVRRLYGRDADGRRKLIEVTEEEQRNLGGDKQRVVSTTSQPNLDGRMQVTRKEIQETSRLNPQTTETKTSVLQPDINGGLRPMEQLIETQTETTPGVVETKSTQQLADGNGRWQTYQSVERVVRTHGDGTNAEEKVQRRDANGQLSLTERTVIREWKDPEGVEQQVTEVYSTNIAGTTRDGDGRLKLDRRMRVTRTGRPDGSQQTTQELEQRSIVAPNDGLRVVERVVESSQPTGAGGTETRKGVQVRDAGGRYPTFIVLRSKTSPH